MLVEARGLTFDVDNDGVRDGRPVLLLHGFPQNAGEWRAVAPRLHAAGLRTIAPNQRGYSPHSRPKDVDAYRVTELAADAVALLDALDIGAVDLVGHDWGALVAWQVAGRYPERVRTLTAVSVPHPVAFYTAITTDPDQKDKSAYMQLLRQPEVAEELMLADSAQALRLAFDGAGLSPAEVDSYVAPLRQPAALNWYRAMSDADLTGLGPITAPSTYVWSNADIAVGRTAAELCAQQVAGEYRFVELPGISHWIADQAPDVLADEILARVASVPR